MQPHLTLQLHRHRLCELYLFSLLCSRLQLLMLLLLRFTHWQPYMPPSLSPLSLSLSRSLPPIHSLTGCSCAWFSPAQHIQQITVCNNCQLTRTSCYTCWTCALAHTRTQTYIIFLIFILQLSPTPFVFPTAPVLSSQSSASCAFVVYAPKTGPHAQT